MEQNTRAERAGEVVAIHLAAASGAPMVDVAAVEAVAGQGLRGDRYFRADPVAAHADDAGTQVTLVEQEAIERVAQEVAAGFTSADSRRNIVTRGIELNDLVGREFRVGEVLLRGVELCEPCAHMTARAGARALRALVHRGGLRASIVRGGVMHLGDPIRAE